MLEAGVLAEFDASDRAVAAARALREDGYSAIVGYTPYPVPELRDTLEPGRTRLPLIVLLSGLAGAVFAYWLQWYTAADSYVLNVGGRPAHAGPAFIPITFETMVLFASCTGFFALFFILGLPRLWAPVSDIEGFDRASVDRFWIGVSERDARFDGARIAARLQSAAPLRVVRLETSG